LKTVTAPQRNGSAHDAQATNRTLNGSSDDLCDIKRGFAQAAAILAELRSRGVMCGILAMAGSNGSTQGKQSQSLDLFGPSQEWSRAAEHWSFAQWQAISAILFNGNTDPHEFLLCHESPNARERFNKAKRADLSYHVEQAYYTVAEVAKRPCGIGFYPWNGATDRQSFWGALDIDAHEGQSPVRARELAARLVAYLQVECPWRPVIACTSGASGGWHVFIFHSEPHPIADWSAFARKLCQAIGATDGDCEIRPNESDERPYGLRAPGSLNPKDGSFGLIAFDSLTEKLRRREWRALQPAKLKLPAASKGSFAKAAITVLAKLLVSKNCSRYAINAVDRRHKHLVRMMGALVHQCGQGLALEAAAQLHKQARPACKTPMDVHLADAAQTFKDLTKKEVDKLNRAERRAYLACKSETERSAFLIVRNWLVRGGGYVHRDTLAAHLKVTGEYAGLIRSRFCARAIMRTDDKYVPHHRSKRYEWLLRDAQQSKNGAES
jgi:hypothetical protein